MALIGIQPSAIEQDPFVGFSDDVPLYVPSQETGDRKILATASNRSQFFNEQRFVIPKPQGTYRIFTLGGSTTYGRPYGDVTSFTSWLREMLPLVDSSRNWEVINAGGISYASYRVAYLMEELVEYQPDLFVIYTGHNEFLEERTYGEIRDMSEILRTTVNTLSRTRTWSAMNSAFEKVGLVPDTKIQKREKLGIEVDAILDKSVGLDQYTRDDPLKLNILEHYKISLERMVSLARSAGAEVIFVTPASNLKDCTPFKSEHSPGLTPEMKHHSAQALMDAERLLQQENWREAFEVLDNVSAKDPRHAGLQYRKGKALLALQRFQEAESALRIARDEDVCPLRALTPIQKIMLEIAEKQETGLVDYVNLIEQRMSESHGHPIPGEEFFLDHVHPTIEGHKILGVALINEMMDLQILHAEPGWEEPVVALAVDTINKKVDREKHGQALANLARVLKWAGKIEDAARLAVQAREVGGDFRQVAVDSASILSSIYIDNQQLEKAVDLIYSTLENAPGALELRLKLGNVLLDPPFMEPQKAAGNLLLVCQQMPNYAWGHTVFGAAMARAGRPDVAYAHLQTALRLNPNDRTAQKNLEWIRPALKGQTPSSDPAQIMLDVYPSKAPRMLVQVRYGRDGIPVPDGIRVEFHENGRVKRYLDINNGIPHGQELTWDEKGGLISNVKYHQGKLIN